jgi:hypothetical protein
MKIIEFLEIKKPPEYTEGFCVDSQEITPCVLLITIKFKNKYKYLFINILHLFKFNLIKLNPIIYLYQNLYPFYILFVHLHYYK